MPKYQVVLVDGRIMLIHSANEELAKKQAIHAETTRIVIAAKRGQDISIPASIPFSVEKIKD